MFRGLASFMICSLGAFTSRCRHVIHFTGTCGSPVAIVCTNVSFRSVDAWMKKSVCVSASSPLALLEFRLCGCGLRKELTFGRFVPNTSSPPEELTILPWSSWRLRLRLLLLSAELRLELRELLLELEPLAAESEIFPTRIPLPFKVLHFLQ